MASFVPPKKNDANGYTFYVSLAPRTADGTWQDNPTLASGDVKIAIDDGAPANLGTLPVVDADFTKRVKVVLSQAETNGDNLTIIFSDAAGAEWCDLTVNLQTAAQTLDEMQTNIGTAGAGLTEAGGTGDQFTAIPWNASWDVEVQSEVADALAVYDPPTKAELDAAVAPLALEATAQDILTDTGTTLPATLATLATAADLATVDGNVDAIKGKTDSLTFTVAGQVDANIQYVNDVAVTGTGASGDEWGPA